LSASLVYMSAQQPRGYVPISHRGATGLASASLADLVTEALAYGTVYDYARQCTDRRELAGRGPVYAIPMGGDRVVVRRVRHGGLLATLTGDVFIAPTRAPYELAVSIRLRDGGVATPEVVGYVLYPAGLALRRADVLTREIPDAADLLSVLRARPRLTDRGDTWEAVHALIRGLGRVGAVHADLNVKNVLIAHAADRPPVAYALDVDRVVWGRPGDAAVVRANWARLERSARKTGVA